MNKRRLMFVSVSSVALIFLLLVSAFAITESDKTSNDASAGVIQLSSVSTVRAISFASAGRVAIFTVSVTGSGVLSVDVSDYNPSNYPDYWRAIIVVYRGPGVAVDRVSDVSVTNVGTPGTGTGYGPYGGRVDMLVATGYQYLVLVSYERGSNMFPSSVQVRFFYSGPTMAVAGPRTGF